MNRKKLCKQLLLVFTFSLFGYLSTYAFICSQFPYRRVSGKPTLAEPTCGFSLLYKGFEIRKEDRFLSIFGRFAPWYDLAFLPAKFTDYYLTGYAFKFDPYRIGPYFMPHFAQRQFFGTEIK